MKNSPVSENDNNNNNNQHLIKQEQDIKEISLMIENFGCNGLNQLHQYHFMAECWKKARYYSFGAFAAMASASIIEAITNAILQRNNLNSPFDADLLDSQYVITGLALFVNIAIILKNMGYNSSSKEERAQVVRDFIDIQQPLRVFYTAFLEQINSSECKENKNIKQLITEIKEAFKTLDLLHSQELDFSQLSSRTLDSIIAAADIIISNIRSIQKIIEQASTVREQQESGFTATIQHYIQSSFAITANFVGNAISSRVNGERDDVELAQNLELKG